MKNNLVERLLYIALLLIFVGVGIAVWVLFAQLHASERTTKEIQQAVMELKADNAASNKRILDHVDCIGLFLSQSNRAEIKIEDLQNCTISGQEHGEQTDTVPVESSPAPGSVNSATPSPNPTPVHSNAPSPEPSPQPNIIQRLIQLIKGGQ